MIITIAGGEPEYRPNDDQLATIELEFAAFDGEVGVGLFPVPDPEAAESIPTGRQFMVEEGTTLLTDGFIIDQDRTRPPFVVGSQRAYGVGVMDANALLDGFRIRRNRPAETDVARVLAFAAADHPSWDTSMVINANTVTMPAKTYDSDGGWTSELIPDTLDYTGKTLFVHDLADGSGRCLHYHTLNSGHACGLAISDVIADVLADPLVFFPGSPMRSRTSVDLRNDIKGTDQAGRTSVQSDSSSIAAHDADGLQHQALAQFEASSQADLNAQTGAMLASLKGDRDTWTCVIGPLGETELALIRVGDLITVTSSVMGLTASAQRIAHMTLGIVQGEGGRTRPWSWTATLELGAPIRRRARVANRALVKRVEHAPIVVIDSDACVRVSFADGSIYDQVVAVNAPTVVDMDFGGDFFMTIAPTNVGIAITDPPQGGSSTLVQYDLDTPIPYGGDTFHIRGRFFFPYISADTLDGPFASGSFVPNGVGVSVQMAVDGTFAGFSARVGASASGGESRKVEAGGDDITWAGTPGWWKYHIKMTSTQWWVSVWLDGDDEPVSFDLGPFSNIGTSIDGVTVGGAMNQDGRQTGTDIGPPPPVMHESYIYEWEPPVICTNVDVLYPFATVAYHWTTYGPTAPQETPDGATDTFTIPAYPGGGYIPGTLVIAVEGIDQVTAQTDPEAGTGTLTWMPTSDELVTMRWLVP